MTVAVTEARRARPKRLAFVLIPGFSLVTLGCAIEAFRMANERAATPPFVCRMLGVGTRQVATNTGLVVTADDVAGGPDPASGAPWDIIFIISSLTSVHFADARFAAWLRRMARAGVAIAPLGAATVLAARLGLLDGYHCVTHWRLYGEFFERFPQVKLGRGLYCIDRKRLTCAGGSAAMDLGLTIVAEVVPEPLATEFAEIAMVPRIRAPTESQRMSVQWRFGVHDERVARAVELMEANIEEPLALAAIARRAGLSMRQLERLFHRELAKGPQRHYLETRLRVAHQLLNDSNDAIITVALKCGFADAAHLTRAFRTVLGTTPAAARAASRARTAHPDEG
jgi:transcriptional regulator GlxA family with amidase domain